MDNGEITEVELADLAENFMNFLVQQATLSLAESLDVEGVELSSILGSI